MKHTYILPNCTIRWGSYDDWKNEEGVSPPACIHPDAKETETDIWGKGTGPDGKEMIYLVRCDEKLNQFHLAYARGDSPAMDVEFITRDIPGSLSAQLKAEMHLSNSAVQYFGSIARGTGINPTPTDGAAKQPTPQGVDERLGKSFHYGIHVGWDVAVKSLQDILRHSDRQWNVSTATKNGEIHVREHDGNGVMLRHVPMVIKQGAVVELHKDGHLTQTYPDKMDFPSITIGYDLNPAEARDTIELFLESNTPAGVARCKAHQSNAMGLGFLAMVVMFYDEEGKVCWNPAVVIPGDTLVFNTESKDFNWRREDGGERVQLSPRRRNCLVKGGDNAQT